MTKATTNVARVAAAVAGFGLVAMSFAPLAGAQTTTTTSTTTTTANTTLTFTRDLTIGSTGSDVMALQTWLISKGFSIPAGPTSYFGSQTRAALAAYQASVAITPAVGYFGPITRAYVNVHASEGTTTGTLPAGCTSTVGYSSTTGVKCSTGGSTSTGSLSGGEADLRNFDLIGGDDVLEGDTGTEIAVAKFDVSGGDVEVQRVTVDLTPTITNGSDSERPWDYIDSLSVYDGSTKIGDVDAGSKNDWDDQDADSDHGDGNTDFYSIDIPVSTVINEDDMAELSIRADAQNTIDSDDLDQTFDLQVPTDGIRAIDAAGIQQYVGDGEEVSVGFDAAENGDLTVRLSSDNPDAGVLVADDTSTSDEFDVLKFEIKNKDSADVDFNELDFDVATTSSAGPDGDITDIIRRATLDLDGDTYSGDINSDNTISFDNLDTSVSGDDTIEGTLSVELYGQSGHYVASGQSLTFSLAGNTSHVDAEGSETGDTATVSGSANGDRQTISLDAGLDVSGTSDNAVLTYNSTDTTKSYGTYTLNFDVSANGDDVFIPRTVATTTTASTTYTGVLVATNLENTFAGTSTASISSSADVDTNNSGFYIVRDGDTESFSVTVTLDPSTTGTYAVGLDSIKYSTVDTDLNSLQTLDIDQTDNDFRTTALAIQN